MEDVKPPPRRDCNEVVWDDTAGKDEFCRPGYF
jgi:hypothetical protein